MNEAKTNLGKNILKITYGLLFVIAGADKFFNFITNWGKYVSKEVLDIIPIELKMFIYIVGAFEIILGLAILFPKTTKIASLVASLWLVIIALNLFLMKVYNDIAVRDVVMAIGVLVLHILTCQEKD